MLRRALFAIGSIALGLLLVYGCDSSKAAANVTIVDAEVREWTDPIDGKVYLAVAPTWRNDGAEDVRSVWIAVELEGPRGKFPEEGAEPERSPFVSYSGDPVAPGSTFRPSDAEETFAVLGLKEEILAKTGPNPRAKATVLMASKEPVDTAPPADPPAH